MENKLKTQEIRKLGEVDVASLKQKVKNISPALWESENKHKPNRFDVLDSTYHIVFKFVNNLDDHRKYHSRPLWQLWESTIQPLLDKAVKPYGYTKNHFPRVMLAKMPSQTKIQAHTDASKAAQYPHKIHIPIETNNETFFFLEEEKFHLEPGKAYEVNNNKLHWSENNGLTDRIHLIFECFGE